MPAESAAALEPRPRPATVPGFPSVDVVAWSNDARVRLTYYGWSDDLVAAGLLPRDAFVIGPSRRRGARTDQDGTRWSVVGHWRLAENGEPTRYFRIGCAKPLALARRLPGANEALEVEALARCRWEQSVGRQAPEAMKRPAIVRLVIDNTRN